MISPQPHKTMKNKAPYEEHNKLTEHMDRSNIPNDDVLMEQMSENQTVKDHNDDNGGKYGN